MERTEIEKNTKLLWQLNDPVQLNNYAVEDRSSLLELLIHSLSGINEIDDYLKSFCDQLKCFNISEFIQTLHQEFGTLEKPKIKDEHFKNEVFSEMDQRFLTAFFLGLNESEHHELRFRINTGIIQGWKEIKELSNG